MEAWVEGDNNYGG